MESLIGVTGKSLLAVGWFLTFLSGQEACYILSGTASLLAIACWLVKLLINIKELKKQRKDVGEI